jgi:hypothetical protein
MKFNFQSFMYRLCWIILAGLAVYILIRIFS